MIVAGKVQKVQRGDKVVVLQPGDPFPEAEQSSVLRALINTGYAVWESDAKPGNVHDDVMMTEAMVRGVEKTADAEKKAKRGPGRPRKTEAL